MIITAEKINGSIPSVAKAIAAKDETISYTWQRARDEIGVDYIDVCAPVDEEIEVETLKWMIDLVQEVTDTPPSLQPQRTCDCGTLQYCNKPGLVNLFLWKGTRSKSYSPSLLIQTAC